jgi:hypothetical protein
VELRFILPSLRKLDLAATEVLVASMTEDERPVRGLAGLLDWRMNGRISALLGNGFATGKLGEVLLIPGKPRLPFDKVILFGLGRAVDFGDRTYCVVVERVLATLEGLKARSAVVELPGRHLDAIKPDAAASVLLEIVNDRPDHDLWTLVESVEAQQLITQQVILERKRVRR